MLGLLAAALVALTAFWMVWGMGARSFAERDPVLVRVESGMSVTQVATTLKEKGLIRSTFWFRVLATLRGATIQPGLFHVTAADTPDEILTMLGQGNVSEKQVTIPEGWRTEEIGERLAENRLVPSVDDFVAAAQVTEQTPVTLRTKLGLAVGDSLSGFLFPDTYRFSTEDSTSQSVVDRLVAAFISRTASLELDYDKVILASIVEREALYDEDRAAIAGVYANRMKLGMKLDADPTVQYGKADRERIKCAAPCEDFDWWPTITVADYQGVDSIFNTYTNPGLPPRPIANPGLASLEAAASPAEHDYLYFLTDAQGRPHFARTAEEHTANKREFLR